MSLLWTLRAHCVDGDIDEEALFYEPYMVKSATSGIRTSNSSNSSGGSTSNEVEWQRRPLCLVQFTADSLECWTYNLSETHSTLLGMSLVSYLSCVDCVDTQITRLHDWSRLRLHMLSSILHQKMGLNLHLPALSGLAGPSSPGSSSNALDPSKPFTKQPYPSRNTGSASKGGTSGSHGRSSKNKIDNGGSQSSAGSGGGSEEPQSYTMGTLDLLMRNPAPSRASTSKGQFSYTRLVRNGTSSRRARSQFPATLSQNAVALGDESGSSGNSIPFEQVLRNYYVPPSISWNPVSVLNTDPVKWHAKQFKKVRYT